MTLERGNKALGVMNRYLEKNAFFAGDVFSVADIALYAMRTCASVPAASSSTPARARVRGYRPSAES